MAESCCGSYVEDDSFRPMQQKRKIHGNGWLYGLFVSGVINMKGMQNRFLARCLCVASMAMIIGGGAKIALASGAGVVDSINVMASILGGNGKLQTAGPFSTEKIYSLEAYVNYSEVKPGIHIQSFKFYTPDGHLYQTVTSAFTARRAKRDEPTSVEANGASVNIQFAPPRRNMTTVWGTLPVAGTWVQRIKGEWRVDAYLDDSTAPVGTANFQVTN